MDPYLVYDLIQEYNNDPSRYTDAEAETIATLANSMGTDFRRESKAMSKGLFDFANTASFGLLPNSLRPVSRGESVYGETGGESFAGGLGTLGGVGLSGALIAKGAGAVTKGARGILDNLKHRARGGTRSSMYDNQLRLGSGSPLPPEPTRLLNPKSPTNLLESSSFSRNLKRNRFPINQTTGQPIPLGGQGPTIRLGGQRQLQLGPDTLLDNADDYLYSRINTPYVSAYGKNLPRETAGRTTAQMRDMYGMDPQKLQQLELDFRRQNRIKRELEYANRMDYDLVRYG